MRVQHHRRSQLWMIRRCSVLLSALAATAMSCTSDNDSAPDDSVDATVVKAQDAETAVVQSTTVGSAGSSTESPSDATGRTGVEVRPVLETFGSELNVEPAADEVGVRKTLLGRDGDTFVLGPAQSANVFSGAETTEEFGIGLVLTLDGPDGTAAFNEIAGRCFEMAATCPTGQLAIVFDDIVLSAPTVAAPTFRDTVSVTGQFTLDEADELTDAINGD